MYSLGRFVGISYEKKKILMGVAMLHVGGYEEMEEMKESKLS